MNIESFRESLDFALEQGFSLQESIEYAWEVRAREKEDN